MWWSDGVLKILIVKIVKHNTYTLVIHQVIKPPFAIDYQPYPLMQVSILTDMLSLFPSYHSFTDLSISASVDDGINVACGSRCLTNAIMAFSSEN